LRPYRPKHKNSKIKLPGNIMSETNEHECSAIDAYIRRAIEQSTEDGPQHPDESPYASSAKSQVDRLLARAAHINEDIACVAEIVSHTSADVSDDISFCKRLAEDLESYDQSIDALSEVIDEGWEPVLTVAAENDDAESKPAIGQPANAHDLQEQLALQNEMIRNLESKLEHLANNSEDQNISSPRLIDDAERIHSDPYLNRVIIATNTTGNLKFPLNQSIINIGREALNDIHIRSRFISRFHARIVSDFDGAIIEDLESRNGLTVNSKKVRRQKLRSGDLIDLGKTQLRYIDLTEGSAGEGSA
jgi:hypothetical protein